MTDGRDLPSAYEVFLKVAEEGEFQPPSPYGWPAEVIVAHVIANDRLIAAHLAEALAGGSPSYDNRPATRKAYLDAISDAAGDWRRLVEAARHSSRVVLALAAMVGEEGGIPYPTFILDGDTVQVDQPLPIRALLAAQARVHLPSHTEQLAALRASHLVGAA